MSREKNINQNFLGKYNWQRHTFRIKKSLSDYLQAVWLYSVTVLIRQPM